MRPLPDFILNAPVGAMELAIGEPKQGTLYRKELAYPGHFVKTKDDGEVEFELPVSEPLIDHWVNTFNAMKQNGVDVPVPIGHTTGPDKRVGTVEKLAKEWNPKRNANALYSYIRFSDADKANQYRNSNVSLFMPPGFTDGRQNKYQRPIRHVAITDYPVIPDLGPFEKAIAASYVLSMAEESNSMTWLDVAQTLGVNVPEGADDEAAQQAVVEAWESEGGGEPDGDEAGMAGNDPGLDDPDLSEDTSGIDDTDGLGFEDDEFGGLGPDDLDPDEDMPQNRGKGRRTSPPEMGFSNPPVILPTIVNQVAEARKTKIQTLVSARKISPAAGKELVKRFCGQQTVSVALSHEAQGGAPDGFDAVIAACSMNTAYPAPQERTMHQTRAEAEKSPVVADAERRAANARNRR